MKDRFGLKSAIRFIRQEGALLIFPIKGKKEPRSLWSCFYPRSKMRWEWDEDGDDRVARLWHLRAQLAESYQVVYSKWYQGRATVFKKELLPPLLVSLNSMNAKSKWVTLEGLSREAHTVLECLGENSPLSTKQLKKLLALEGSSIESKYSRIMSELFGRGLVVGVGEVDDGAFPSLAIGATQLYFEKEWNQATALDLLTSMTTLKAEWGEESLFFKQVQRYRAKYLNSRHRASFKRSARPEISFEDLVRK